MQKRHLCLRQQSRRERHHPYRPEQRNLGVLQTRRHDIRRLQIPRRVCRRPHQELHLPQLGSHLHLQRRAVHVEKRPRRPAQREDDRHPSLPDDTPQRRRHRSGHHPQRPVWRGVLLVCQRPTYDTGGHPPVGLQRGGVAHHKGVFLQELRICRHSQRHGSRHQHQGRGTGLRVADQDQTQFARHGSRRPHGEQVHRRLPEKGARQLPPPQQRDQRDTAQKDTRLRERAQSHCRCLEDCP